MKVLPSIILLLALCTAAAPSFAQDKTPDKTTHKSTAKPAESTPAPAPAAAAPADDASGNSAPPAPDEPGQFAAAFFGQLEKSRVEEAYANLMRGSKIADRPEELKELKSKTSKAIEMFGAIQGFDLVETKTVGSHLMRRTYLSLGKEFPLRWRFYFYLSMGRWRLVDLRVDDRLTGTFDEPEEPKADSPTAR